MPPPYRPPMPPPPPPYYPPAPPAPRPPMDNIEVRNIFVGRVVRDELLHLRILGNIGREFSGWDVLSIRARTRSTSPDRTTAQLVVDGNVVAEEINPGRSIDLIPNQNVVLGVNSESLDLLIAGETFVESVQVELRRGDFYPGNYEVSVPLNIPVVGQSNIDLNPYLDALRNQGQVVDHVVITANNRQAEFSSVSLLLNEQEIGRVFYDNGLSQESLWFEDGFLVGNDQDSLVLSVNGDMMIDNIVFVLK